MTLNYITRIPRQLPEGMVLVHNSVMPYRRLNTNGFRAWTQPRDDDLLEVCNCDWAGVALHGLVHYRFQRLGMKQR